jgi:hypothetical protein
MSEPSSRVIVFAGSSTEAAIVQSFLESNGIAADLVDEHIGSVAPHVAAGGGAGAVKVAVADGDAVTARELLADVGRRARP